MTDILLFQNMYIKAIQSVMLYQIFATFRNRQHANKYQAARIISECLTITVNHATKMFHWYIRV